MNKKGQISGVFSAVVVIILTGVLFTIFTPTIDDFREQQIEDTPSDDVLTKLLLIGLKPIMWALYIVLSVFALIFTVNASSGRL